MLGSFGNQQLLGSPLLWWGQVFAECWTGIRPILQSHQRDICQSQAQGCGKRTHIITSVLSHLVPTTNTFQNSIFNAEKLYTRLWICLSTWWEPHHQGPQPLRFTYVPLYFCSTLLQLAKHLARSQVNKGKPFLGFSRDKIINDDKQYRLYCTETIRDTLIQTQKISTKCFLSGNVLALKNISEILETLILWTNTIFFLKTFSSTC